MSRNFLFVAVALSCVLFGSSQDTIVETAADIHGGIAYPDINAPPLIQAAATNKIDIISDLVASGSDINVQNENGWTPLIFAVETGHNMAFNTLINLGANVNFQEKDGWTALMFAAYHGDMHMLKSILEVGGGDPLILNNAGFAAHSIAANAGHVDVAQYIAEAALVQAMTHNDLQSSVSLIREGAFVNHQNGNGWTALTLASSLNAAAEVDILIRELRANVNLPENDGWTPLMFAANNNFQEVAKLLLDAGADVNYESSRGVSATSLATDEGFPDMLDLLAGYKTKSAAPKAAIFDVTPPGEKKTATATGATIDAAAIPAAKEPEKAPEKKKRGFWG